MIAMYHLVLHVDWLAVLRYRPIDMTNDGGWGRYNRRQVWDRPHPGGLVWQWRRSTRSWEARGNPKIPEREYLFAPSKF